MGLYVLLPPSEGKSAEAGTGLSFAEALPHGARCVKPVLKILRAVPKGERAKYYGVSTKDKAEAAHKLNLAALDAPGLPAIERYTGVVYGFIDQATLRHPDYAREHLLIVSALFGLITAGTPIPEYKLSMNPWLAKHWKPINTARIELLAKGDAVLSLLPGAHAKAVGYAPLVSVDFKIEGGKKSAGHFGKAIKGKFARFLMENQIVDVKDIAAFKEDGYVFDGTDFVQR
jgi:cytoplasmic iron level regulating protein YaaA (DUF328/UPF0246 family)